MNGERRETQSHRPELHLVHGGAERGGDLIDLAERARKRKEPVMEGLHACEDELMEALGELVHANRGNASVLQFVRRRMPEVMFKMTSLARQSADISLEEWRAFNRAKLAEQAAR